MQPNMLFKFFLLGMAVHGGMARLGGEDEMYARYRVKQRSLTTSIITEAELNEYMLTFSFDTKPVPLKPFYVDFESTDGVLPANSIALLEGAMSEFVLTVLKDQFHSSGLERIKAVSTSIKNQTAIGGTTYFFGSSVAMQVNVTFRTEPSPPPEVVEAKLAKLMLDPDEMETLVIIVRRLATEAQDEELLYVNGAKGRTSSVDPSSVQTGGTVNGQGESDNTTITTVVPAAAASALLVAGMILLLMKMKNKDENSEASSDGRKGKVVLDDESDIFSYEAPLAESPPSSDPLSPASIETDQQSDVVVVEIDSESMSVTSTGTGTGMGNSVFSFFSRGDKINRGNARSKRAQSARSRHVGMFSTPTSRVSELHVYSEEEEEDLVSIGDEQESLASESPQDTPSPNQPYESITLDELLVSKYSTHVDVDLVSPVQASSASALNTMPHDNKSLQVVTSTDQRTIISGATSPILSPPPPYYAQSPSSRRSPLTSPRPPLYKASPSVKAPASQAPSPQKAVANSSVLQGSPEIWSTTTSHYKSPGVEVSNAIKSPPRSVRSSKSMSPQIPSTNSPENMSVDIWSQKVITSPRKGTSPENEIRRLSNISASGNTKSRSPDPPEGGANCSNVEQRQDATTDRAQDSVERVPGGMAQDSAGMKDPWIDKPMKTSSNPSRRTVRSASPVKRKDCYGKTTQTPQFFPGVCSSLPIRIAKSESPPKREGYRNGKQPPAEVWNQPLFAQERSAGRVQHVSPRRSDYHRSPGTSLDPVPGIAHQSSVMITETKGTNYQTPLATQAAESTTLAIKLPGKSSPEKWSFRTAVDAAGEAASSVGLSFGDPRGIEQNDSSIKFLSSRRGSKESMLVPIGSEDSLERRMIYSKSFSPDTEKIKNDKRRFSEGQERGRRFSPRWSVRQKPIQGKNSPRKIAATSPRKSPRSPGHGDKTEFGSKRLRTSLEFSEMKQEANGSNRRKSSGNTPTKQKPLRLSMGRRHARYSVADGSTDYQEMLQHRDGDVSSFDVASLSDSDVSFVPATTPRSPSRNPFAGSPDDSADDSALEGQKGQKLLMDLVWLEKKISGQSKAAGQRLSPFSNDDSSYTGLSEMSHAFNNRRDSMSFTSVDGFVESEAESVGQDKDGDAGEGIEMSSVICRDCFAPPGKLRIVIQSTNDGPSVHTVKKGSSLEGHLFPGDLIVSVDDTDTRSYTAEQVMRLMASRTDHERKITVLHFEKETPLARKVRKN